MSERTVGPVHHNDCVTRSAVPLVPDTAAVRKARGAFFTPPEIANYIAQWAVRSPDERVLEPSAGDAAFLVAASHRLHELGAGAKHPPVLDGVEIHADSAKMARRRVRAAGAQPRIRTADFFTVEPTASYTAVIGNPPYIRYQDFRGEPRSQSRRAALRAGVALSGLASSWAAFTVHAALFLEDGGRLGLVLPAELLSVNYAAAVRKFLFESFRTIELVLFDERVFPQAEADVVLLLADGFNQGPSDHAIIHRATNAASLTTELVQRRWSPVDPAEKWVSGLIGSEPVDAVRAMTAAGSFTTLDEWGDTTLGIVTGNNGFFALSADRVAELGLTATDLVPLSPPGSAHLRGLTLSRDGLKRLQAAGKSVNLFRPGGDLSPAAERYVAAGRAAGVHLAYKCRVRRPWYLVPLLKSADLLLTCMNADTPRLVTNSAKAHHLNSVHGVYLDVAVAALGRDLLPLAALNSVTVLHAEMVGRSYGGGILKIEPREADRWVVPSPGLIGARAAQLTDAKRRVASLLRRGLLVDAVALVDRALGLEQLLGSASRLESVRAGRDSLAARRQSRSRRGR